MSTSPVASLMKYGATSGTTWVWVPAETKTLTAEPLGGSLLGLGFWPTMSFLGAVRAVGRRLHA